MLTTISLPSYVQHTLGQTTGVVQHFGQIQWSPVLYIPELTPAS